MTFGGIYREVSLRIVPALFIDNIFARTHRSLRQSLTRRRLLLGRSSSVTDPLALEAELPTATKDRPGKQTPPFSYLQPPNPAVQHDPPPRPTPHPHPALGRRQPQPLRGPRSPAQRRPTPRQDTRRIGFREANFTPQGFSLNGKVVKLRGLDRHQTFPFVGQAMPARVQRRDAHILRNDLNCNIVRTSHYPQSRHFLDACDEIGLLVLEEIPGWQHIGDQAWQDIAVDNVGRMIRRDWNHPSIILWGVRINESRDDHDFYTRTNALAHASTRRAKPAASATSRLRISRRRFHHERLRLPTEAAQPSPLSQYRVRRPHLPTKTTDNDERQREHTLRHARIHNQLASDPQYAGGIGWCAFDYNTHSNFGSGDRICYHGVSDIFREPKPAAGFYKSQCDPDEEIVLEPAFHWARGDESIGFTKAVICSNCDHLKLYIAGRSKAILSSSRKPIPTAKKFPHLKYPPFIFEVRRYHFEWGDLRIDGFFDGKQVISKSLSGRGVDSKFALLPDDHALAADGADSSRVVLRVTDEFGAIRTYADDPIVLTLEGPADLIGDNPFSLIGGTGAVWIRAREQAGTVRLTAKHPRLGSQTISIDLHSVPPEFI